MNSIPEMWVELSIKTKGSFLELKRQLFPTGIQWHKQSDALVFPQLVLIPSPKCFECGGRSWRVCVCGEWIILRPAMPCTDVIPLIREALKRALALRWVRVRRIYHNEKISHFQNHSGANGSLDSSHSPIKLNPWSGASRSPVSPAGCPTPGCIISFLCLFPRASSGWC